MFKLIALFLSILLSFSACSNNNDIEHKPTFIGDIQDTESWYEDENNVLIRVDVVIPSPNENLCTSYENQTEPLRPCTLEDINSDENPDDAYKPELRVLMSSGEFANNVLSVNSTFKIKGGYSRTADQKSYSVKLDSKEDLFLNQRKFSFTKSQSDRSRVKNKLAFDLFRLIPNITSLKLQFTHLFIDGIDYGLFTHIEQIREEYLVNRGWNKDDNLYNANNFYFRDYGELSVNSSGEPISPDAFNTVLEIKNGKDHSKVVDMLNAVNSDMNIDDVIDKYFNRDNYMKWLAINIIFSNKDTVHHNYYLYNPKYGDKFYFLPWDYDGAWSSPKYLSKYEYGISLWWDVPLHRKFFSVEKNRNDLYAMVDTLRKEYITTKNIEKYLSLYEDTVRPFASVLPDSDHNSDSSWLRANESLISGIQDNIDLYESVIGHPMPFNLFIVDSGLEWEESIDLEGDEVVYDLQIADNPDFNNSIVNIADLAERKYEITFNPGTYYIKLISKETQDASHFQLTYDKLKENDIYYFGVRKHVVE